MEFLTTPMACVIASMCLFAFSVVIYRLQCLDNIRVKEVMARTAVLVAKVPNEEGRARTRTFFLQGVDNLQSWKLGGKIMGFAFKVPFEALYLDTVDLGKYLTDEELAAFKVGIEVYGKDDRTSSIAKDFTW